MDRKEGFEFGKSVSHMKHFRLAGKNVVFNEMALWLVGLFECLASIASVVVTLRRR